MALKCEQFTFFGGAADADADGDGDYDSYTDSGGCDSGGVVHVCCQSQPFNSEISCAQWKVLSILYSWQGLNPHLRG